MANVDPYNTGGDPSHPGVSGQSVGGVGPKASPEVAPGQKVDNPGTGTFPPEQQGNVNQAQPAGLASDVQYGQDAPGDAYKDVADPQTHPTIEVKDQVDDPEISSDEDEFVEEEE
jgi:hypothetical protein